MGKFLRLTSLFSVSIFICTLQAQPVMFRQTAEHTSYISSKQDYIFGEQAWKFETEAPIRSTAVCSNNTVYFGNSKGILFALDRSSGVIKWQYNAGYAIASSPALWNGNILFSDNKQSLHSLNASTGKQNWQLDFGANLPNDWGFDYYYSSPTIADGKIFVGGKDGFVYNVAADGKVTWKFKADNIVRSTPAVSDNAVFFGDIDGNLYRVDATTGKELWRFKTIGNGLKNEDFGFDRRAIISSPTIAKDKVIVGCRDGFFYAVDKNNELADAFGATKTPECFLFNKKATLVYHGAIDDNPQDDSKVQRHHLKEAINEMLSGKKITVEESRSVGCGIKRI